jgi:hypothetical protein
VEASPSAEMSTEASPSVEVSPPTEVSTEASLTISEENSPEAESPEDEPPQEQNGIQRARIRTIDRFLIKNCFFKIQTSF